MTVATAPVEGLIPFYPIWELQLYKVDKFWAFDLPDYDVYGELLCGGTEKVLNHYYYVIHGYESRDGDKLNIRLYNGDEVTPELYTSKLIDPREDPDEPNCTIYHDRGTGMEVWLCPFLHTLWGSSPTVIYVDF